MAGAEHALDPGQAVAAIAQGRPAGEVDVHINWSGRVRHPVVTPSCDELVVSRAALELIGPGSAD
jgi:hypothetical protein